MRRTKIVCTLGPASSGAGVIGSLLDAGMDVVRLNFSHGTHEQHAANMETVRKAAADRDRMIPIIADLQGPKIRTGRLEGGGPVQLEQGGTLRLTSEEVVGSARRVSIDYAHLAEEVGAGERILLDDGAIELRVKGKEGDDVLCEVVSGGALSERKGVNIPGVALKLPSVTEKDKEDLRFALSHDVDYVALSFVRQSQDVQELRRLMGKQNGDSQIIAKLEKPQALDDLHAILQAADGVMVARGDLGVELSPWKVPVAQKRIIDQAGRFRKPVITATQMLESMMRSPTPTRAEASDVANAVFDGSDALMLSGETAVGNYPVRAVKMMSRIIEAAEESTADFPTAPLAPALEEFEVSDAVAESAVGLSERLRVKYIVVYSESGYTARLMSKRRPSSVILGLSRNLRVCQQMKLLWGVRAKPIQQVHNIDDLVPKVESMLLDLDWVRPGDLVCVTAGTPFEIPGKTDLIKLHRIGDST